MDKKTPYNKSPSKVVKNTTEPSNNTELQTKTLTSIFISPGYTLPAPSSDDTSNTPKVYVISTTYKGTTILGSEEDEVKKVAIKHKTHKVELKKVKSKYGEEKEVKDFVDDENSKYNQILKKLKGTNQKFSDPSFPPDAKSLGETESYDNSQLIWCRPEEYYGKGFKLYEGDVSVDDIKQGQLGDCYFLCTLAAMAAWPHRIHRLFVNKELSEQGCYAIRIHDLGEWNEIIVDDMLPCWAETKQLAFAAGNGKELWVCLLEKAWAKLFGSFSRIEAGDAKEALHNLTGAPTVEYVFEELDDDAKENLWKIIMESYKSGFLMTCSTPCAEGLTDKDDRDGIFWGHAYSLLSAHEVTKDGKPVRLLRIRNPHSRGEFTGNWSDESPCWTEETKKAVNWKDEDDGTFFMAWEDFFEYYEDCQICKIHDDYHYSSLRIDNVKPNECLYIKLSIPGDGKYYTCVNQENKRHHTDDEGFKHSPVYMLITHDEDGRFKEIDQVNAFGSEVTCNTELKGGDHHVFIQIDWIDGEKHPIVLGVYGPHDVSITRLKESDCPTFVTYCQSYQ